MEKKNPKISWEKVAKVVNMVRTEERSFFRKKGKKGLVIKLNTKKHVAEQGQARDATVVGKNTTELTAFDTSVASIIASLASLWMGRVTTSPYKQNIQDHPVYTIKVI